MPESKSSLEKKKAKKGNRVSNMQGIRYTPYRTQSQDNFSIPCLRPDHACMLSMESFSRFAAVTGVHKPNLSLTLFPTNRL